MCFVAPFCSVPSHLFIYFCVHFNDVICVYFSVCRNRKKATILYMRTRVHFMSRTDPRSALFRFISFIRFSWPRWKSTDKWGEKKQTNKKKTVFFSFFLVFAIYYVHSWMSNENTDRSQMETKHSNRIPRRDKEKRFFCVLFLFSSPFSTSLFFFLKSPVAFKNNAHTHTPISVRVQFFNLKAFNFTKIQRA